MTAAKIAQHLGLAPTTVSHVLGGRAAKLRIHPDTQARIYTAAQEMGYRANTSARAMRTGRFGVAALIQPMQAVYLPPGLIMGMASELQRRNMHLAISEAPNDVLNDVGYLPKVVREISADGLLLNMIIDLSPSFLEAVRAHQIPMIRINRRQETDCIHPDDRAGARLAAEHLLRLGHRRIAYIKAGSMDDPAQHYSVNDRRQGYEDAMRAAGLTPQSLTLPYEIGDHGLPLVDQRVEDTRRLLTSQDRPTALIAYEIDTAQPILLAALQMGLRVPGDLSLLTFHAGVNLETGIPITTVELPIWSIGQKAVEMLCEKIAAPERILPACAVPLTLMEGSTCGPPV